jgi:GT2 family glycosyltransferase
MTVYIVIPVHNRFEKTRDCLRSLQQQKEDDFTIVVVDDGSTDETKEMIRNEFPQVVLLSGSGNLWWVGAVNKGLRYVMSVCKLEDYILILNNDLVVLSDYITNLLRAAQSKPNAIIGSVETTEKSPNIIKNGGYDVKWNTAKNTIINKGKNLGEFPNHFLMPVSKLTGRGTLFPSTVFREVGLYDCDHFKQCGDTELTSRALLQYGYDLFVSYDAVVISCMDENDNINARSYYTLAEFKEYFFGIKSHHNIKDHYWFARKVAPNKLWFFRFVSLEFIRNVYHFISRLRLFNLKY